MSNMPRKSTEGRKRDESDESSESKVTLPWAKSSRKHSTLEVHRSPLQSE